MITINGVKYEGRSVEVRGDGTVIIDGRIANVPPDGKATGVVRIEVSGNLASLRSDASVVVHGSVHGDVNAGGSVTCHDIGGNLNAGGSVTADRALGGITAGGSVRVSR